MSTNTKTINTRIQNRFDILDNWSADGVELLHGEIALVSVTTQQKDDNGNIINVPAVLMKVGANYTHDECYEKAHATGNTDFMDLVGKPKPFNELPWLSAKAADVYGWAKTEHAKDVNVTIITGSGTDTKTETKTLGEWLKATLDADATNAAAIAEVSGKVNLADGTTVTAAIEEAITAFKDGLVHNNNKQDAIQIVKEVTQADGKVTVTYGYIDPGELPVLNASQIFTNVNCVQTVENKLGEIDSKIAEINTTIAGGVHFIGITATDVTTTDNKNSAEVSINTDEGNVLVDANQGDIVIYNTREFIWTGSVWEELGDVTRIGTLETKISNLDFTETNNPIDTHKFVSQVIQTDGQIAVTYTQPTAADISYAAEKTVYGELAELAATQAAVKADYMRIGTDAHLYAGTGGTDVIIFNCGSASGWAN